MRMYKAYLHIVQDPWLTVAGVVLSLWLVYIILSSPLLSVTRRVLNKSYERSSPLQLMQESSPLAWSTPRGGIVHRYDTHKPQPRRPSLRAHALDLPPLHPRLHNTRGCVSPHEAGPLRHHCHLRKPRVPPSLLLRCRVGSRMAGHSIFG